MPEDARIIKNSSANGSSPECKDSSVTLEELEHFIRQWVQVILSNIDPPPDLWKRIKQRAERSFHIGNSCGI